MNNEYHVHIACIGDIKEPTMAIVRSGTGIDEVVLLNNKNSEYVQRQKEIEETLKESFIPRIVSEEIDIFDFQMITKKLIDIVKRCRTEHPGCTIHFNITAGTNIVGSAMCVVAMRFQNTDIYYQKWKKHDPKLENGDFIYDTNDADMNKILSPICRRGVIKCSDHIVERSEKLELFKRGILAVETESEVFMGAIKEF